MRVILMTEGKHDERRAGLFSLVQDRELLEAFDLTRDDQAAFIIEVNEKAN